MKEDSKSNSKAFLARREVRICCVRPTGRSVSTMMRTDTGIHPEPNDGSYTKILKPKVASS